MKCSWFVNSPAVVARWDPDAIHLIQMPSIDPTFTRPSTLLQYQGQTRGEPLSVMIAAGPYTLDSDLKYAPLAALLEKAVEERPDVLILVS